MAFRPGIWYHAREEGVVVHGTDRRKTQDRHKLPRCDRQRPARRGASARRQHGQARGRGASGRRDGSAAGARRHGLVRAAVPLSVFAHAARGAGRQARAGRSAGAGGGARALGGDGTQRRAAAVSGRELYLPRLLAGGAAHLPCARSAPRRGASRSRRVPESGALPTGCTCADGAGW